ncbi:MAG TPA: metal-dependent transcriptional regulator [Solirubrobacterales bacterium]|nr:metal-dependent transcriptional regulator [Solirubrobacterales bacterium]
MQATEPRAPSAAAEDYLKAIYSLTRGDRGAASTTDLAARLGVSAGSVSTMVKRLDDAGLVSHAPYRGVGLTAEGERLALGVIRRHRLLEAFLTSSLGIPWDEVHGYAEELEHAASDELIEVIAARLGDPEADPHGDPIPTRELDIDERQTETLAGLEPGARATIVRVSDFDPAMLRYLDERGIGIGDEVEMIGRQPFDGPCEIKVGRHRHALGLALAHAISVRRQALATGTRGDVRPPRSVPVSD